MGHTAAGYHEVVDYTCPRPEDGADLMDGWAATDVRLLAPEVDPVTTAAVLAFGFVFVHPFFDGNGRLHRWLLHHVLARRGFGPEDVVLPVSAAILRDHTTTTRPSNASPTPSRPTSTPSWAPTGT